jgi:hypothetical protein
MSRIKKIELLKKSLEDKFVLQFPTESFIAASNIFSSKNKEFHNIASSLKEHLLSIISSCTLPEKMANSHSIHTILGTYLQKELILTLLIPEEIPFDEWRKGESDRVQSIKKDREQIAHKHALSKCDKYLKSRRGKEKIFQLNLEFMKLISEDDSFLESASDLLNQTALSIWTAFEVFCRDCFIFLLNNDSSIAKSIVSNTELKQRFNLKNIPTEKLFDYDFDLSKRMGSLLISNFDFSS